MRMLFLLFVLQTFMLTAQSDSLLIPYRSGDKWGFSDVNKSMVIPLMYIKVFPFNHGMALVQNGEKWTLINRQNIELSQFGNNPEELLAIRMHFASADLGKYSYPKDVRMESDLPFVISEHIRSLGKLLLYDIEDKTQMDTISEKYIYDRIIARTNQTYFVFKNKKV